MADTVVVGIIVSDSKVLLVRRRLAEGKLKWQFPGGRIEALETEVQALEREVFEEVGIECRARRKLGERVHPDTGMTVAYWSCEALGDKAEVADRDELSESRWIKVTELPTFITSDLFEPVRRYLAHLPDLSSSA